jgi:EAL domain-containing protein (putative c-di-GMP-specific phosphodiesterase class I)
MLINHHTARPFNGNPTLGGEADFEFSFAFQPIVNATTHQVISFEALVRGPGGEPSADVFARVHRSNLFRFDQTCRLKALQLASRLNLQTQLNINLFPKSIYLTGLNIRTTLEASLEYGIPIENIVFEVSEGGKLSDYRRMFNIFRSNQAFGFRTAFDDFGSGYSGLRQLLEYQPNYIKLARNLIADIHADCVKQAIVQAMVQVCRQLSIEIMAEGIEKAEEYRWLRQAGVNLFQGYYFARPVFEALSEVSPKLFLM